MKQSSINTRFLLALGLGAFATLTLLYLLWSLSGPSLAHATHDSVADAHTQVLTVCPAGPPACDYSSVQAAVDAAADGVLIKVAQGTYTGVQRRPVPPGYPYPPASGFITQVVYVSKSLTLRGGYTTAFTEPPDPEAHPTTLDAQALGRVLSIAGSVSVTVEGFRITSGDASGLGGADYSSHGGGLYVISATATISSNWVFSNTAQVGGGSGFWRSDTTLKGNTVLSNTAIAGGGLVSWGGTVALSGNAVYSNTADYGGGLALFYGEATLTGNTVFSNTAEQGGGVWVVGGVVTLTGNAILSNTAPYDAAVRLDGTDSATLNGNTIQGQAQLGGVAAFNCANVALSGNVIQGHGHGFYAQTSANVSLSRNTIQRNEGCGVSFYVCDNAELSENLIQDNAGVGVLASGNGILLPTGTNVSVSGNTIQSNRGGGVHLRDCSTAILSGNSILSNTAQGDGGGVFLYRCSGTLSGNTILSNTAQGDGGGLYTERYVVLSDNTLGNNTAHVKGGGVYLEGGSLGGNMIVGNTAHDGGGVYLAWGYDNVLGGNMILGNAAHDSGGGVYLWSSHNTTLDNNVIADNQAGTAGSGLYLAGGTARLRHTTLARNGSDGDGTGLYVTATHFAAGTPTLINTLLVSHTVGITVTAGNTVTLEATLWGDGAWANGADWGGDGAVITGMHDYWGDPAFVDPAAGDYHIGPSSAARDAGVDAGVLFDIDGEPRFTAPDLGADEYWPPGALKYIFLPLMLRGY